MKTIREQFKVGDLAWVTHDKRQYVGEIERTNSEEIEVDHNRFLKDYDSDHRIFRKLIDGEWIVIEDQQTDMERFDEASFTGKEIREAYDKWYSGGMGDFERMLDGKGSGNKLAQALFNMMEEK